MGCGMGGRKLKWMADAFVWLLGTVLVCYTDFIPREGNGSGSGSDRIMHTLTQIFV